MPLLPDNAGQFPRLGFGLWRIPVAATIMELVIALVGSYLFGRAAQRGAASVPGGSGHRTNLAGALILLFGLSVLALDFTGVLD